ncbi:MAG: aspartate aminotransferase family protein [Gemmatimonadetes bacterium]|nr:aspartate aminotransferase family protein [Gemmatimonadota bacterium]
MSSALQGEIDRYVRANPKSAELHEQAVRFMPGGETRNSIWWPPFPTYVVRGAGSRVWDVDGNERVDFINNMTTLILGHGHPAVVRALREQAERGPSFPAPAPSVVRWAELMCGRVKSVERVRFTNSGTEATMNAIRAARAFTGREKVGKFEGGYHGTHDLANVSVASPLEKAGDARRPNAVLVSEGVPAGVADTVVVMPYNDLEASERIIRENAGDLAAVIVEPVWGQAMVPSEEGFLVGLRALADELGFVLIFDEVISFRVSPGGGQAHYGVRPDLTAFGKIIGGGLPVGAFGGRQDVMAVYDPTRGRPRVPQAGTFNGNPMTAAAGIATLEALTPEVYDHLNRLGERVRERLQRVITEREAPMGVTGLASLFSLQFTPERVRDYRTAATNDSQLQRNVFLGLLNEGFLLSNRCAGCTSAAHTERDVDALAAAFGRVLDRAGYG